MKFKVSENIKGMKKGRIRWCRFVPLIAMAAILAVGFGSCKKKELKEADVVITDPDRHYYPVIQGQYLPIQYEIENISDEPLVIQEIQTSCGCLIPKDELPIIVLPNKKNTIKLAYNSNKNTGYVDHQIYLYGNFKDSALRVLTFDTHVVPPADYTRDYEVLYQEEMEKGVPSLKDMVDGTSVNKGYYTDEEGDVRENNRKEKQDNVDDIINSTLKR